jgi:hypothetical protein
MEFHFRNVIGAEGRVQIGQLIRSRLQDPSISTGIVMTKLILAVIPISRSFLFTVSNAWTNLRHLFKNFVRLVPN